MPEQAEIVQKLARERAASRMRTMVDSYVREERKKRDELSKKYHDLCIASKIASNDTCQRLGKTLSEQNQKCAVLEQVKADLLGRVKRMELGHE